MKYSLLALIFAVLLYNARINAQILHTESFSVIMDSTRIIKGSIVPDFEFQTQKKNLTEFENMMDITFKLDKNVLTVANKIELSKYGSEVLMSSSYLYLEYIRLVETRLAFEPFSEFHFKDARGLDFKLAAGIKTRYIIVHHNSIGLYAGTGPFYEYERWNYDGVDDDLVPADAGDKYNKNIKLGTYMSFKWNIGNKLGIDLSAYHQSRFDEIITTPRIASSTSLSFELMEHLGLILIYQNVYDYKPVVPIDNLFSRVILSMEISF